MKLENQTNMYLVNPINTGMQDWDQTNISIIIPAYNCHNTIVQTLASIAMQENIHEIETIIADDCSDHGYDEIAKIFSNFMKIKVVRLLKGGGPGTARQVGYDHSVGSYVMFMDGDDSLIGCDAVNILKKVMIEKEQDCVYGQFLEQSETGDLLTHEIHMVWMFGKLYRRSFLEHYNIRMNMSHSNEDTGYNCVVKGCSNKIWYIPKPVYTWRFKPNSITRFNNGMYGSESGMCGYLTNMIWQIKELEKRFVNKNYILEQIISIMCVLYHFYIENMQTYPLGTDANLEWIRYYYEQCYKPYERLIEEATLNQIFARVAAEQNIAGKGVIPKITFFDFMKEVKAKPYTHNKMHDVGGSVIEIPQTTPENYPVEVNTYFNLLPIPKQNTNTNLSRMDGMQKILDDDKKQRAEFLEDEILPHVKKKEDNNDMITTSKYSKLLIRTEPISYHIFRKCIEEMKYIPALSTALCDVPLPFVEIDDTLAEVPAVFLYRYYMETGELMRFDFYRAEDRTVHSRQEFLLIHSLFEDSNNIVHRIEEVTTPIIKDSKSNTARSSTSDFHNPNTIITAQNTDEAISTMTSGFVSIADPSGSGLEHCPDFEGIITSINTDHANKDIDAPKTFGCTVNEPANISNDNKDTDAPKTFGCTVNEPANISNDNKDTDVADNTGTSKRNKNSIRNK